MRGADVFLGCSAAGRADRPRWSQSMAAAADHPRARQPRARDPPRARARRRGPTASSRPAARDYPNQVNNVLCFPYIFRGALDCGATHDHRGDEARLRARDRGARQGRGERRGRRGLRRQGAEVRARLHHPQAVRPAADPAHRAGGRAGRGRVGRRDAADRRPRRLPAERSAASSTTPACSCGRCSPPQARARRASSSPRARTSACCARCRSCSTRAWRSRSWSAAPRSSTMRIERAGLRLQAGTRLRARATPRTTRAFAATGRTTAAHGPRRRHARYRRRRRCAARTR